MRRPLQVMLLRTFETDAKSTDPRFTSKLNAKRSPLGGDYGPVRSSHNHQGWDLVASAGTPVFAIADGTVEWVHAFSGRPKNDPYGNQVCVRTNLKRRGTGQPIWAFYAHLLIYFVNPKQVVREGQMLGLIGNSGNAQDTPSHLHFEIRSSGAHLGQGLLYRLHPGEVLGYQYHACIEQLDAR
jgi:murein DD-endopeptidase MepM/ murein hydrolase activator NlpD